MEKLGSLDKSKKIIDGKKRRRFDKRMVYGIYLGDS